MVPLSLVRSRPVVIALAVGFAFTGGHYAVVFLLSLYYQQHRGLTPLGTGLAFLPVADVTCARQRPLRGPQPQRSAAVAPIRSG